MTVATVTRTPAGTEAEQPGPASGPGGAEDEEMAAMERGAAARRDGAAAWRRGPGYTPPWGVSSVVTAIRPGLQRVLFAALGLAIPTRIRGWEHLARLPGPVIFVANHTSHLDCALIARSLPGPWRERLAVGAAADYFFANPLVGAAVAALINAFPLARMGIARASLGRCCWLLEHGWSVLLFPEGTRSTTGRIGAFHPGAGLLAAAVGVPVVPVHVAGTAAVLPKGRLIPRPGPVTVSIGAPLRPARGASHHAAAASLTAAVRALAPAGDRAGLAASGQQSATDGAAAADRRRA